MMSNSYIMRRRLAVAGTLLLAAAGPLAACGSDSEDSSSDAGGDEQNGSTEVSVSDAWARAGTAGGNSAIYMELTGGIEDDALVSAAVPTDVAAEAQVHETMMADDEMTDDSMTDDSMTDGDDAEMTDDSVADGHDGDDAEMTDDSMTDGDDGNGSSGMMTMQQVDSISIPADETVKLEPGSYHIMMLDLQSDLAVGDAVDVTLTFESGTEQTVTVEVKES